MEKKHQLKLGINEYGPREPGPEFWESFGEILERKLIEDFAVGKFSVESDFDIPGPLKERLLEVVKKSFKAIAETQLKELESK